MYNKSKNYTHCVNCGGSFPGLQYIAKGLCRPCYNKSYNKKNYHKNKHKYKYNQNKFYFKRRKNDIVISDNQLRKENMKKLYDFIDYAHRNSFYIDYVGALRLVDLFEIYYTGPSNKIDGLVIEDQLIYMWNFIKKLK